MRANSLALRLFLSATAWTVVILLVTGFVLSGLYRQAVERAFDRRLSVYLKTLIADVASPEIPNEKAGQTLGEPMFRSEIDPSFCLDGGAPVLTAVVPLVRTRGAGDALEAIAGQVGPR